MEMGDDRANEILRILRDIRFLLWIGQRREIEDLVAEAFEDPEQRKAYRLLADGNSYRQIGDAVGSSHGTVGKWVRKWRDLGLIDPDDTTPTVDPETLRI